MSIFRSLRYLRKKSNLLRLLLAVPVLLLTFTGCSKTVVTIGVNKWPPCEIWYVAEKLKKPGSLGVRLKIIRYPSWRSNIESFYEGNTDVTHSSYFNFVYYYNRGLKGYLGVVADRIIGADGMVTAPSITDIYELKGKKIGVEVDTDEYFLLYKILKNHFLSLKDVVLVSINSSEAGEYLKSGNVRAVVTYEPFLSEAARYGRRSESTLQYPDIMQDILVFSDRIVRNKKLEGKIKKIWFGTLNWIFESKENLRKASDIMAEAENGNADDYLRFFSRFYFYSEQDNKKLLKVNGRTERILKEMSDFLYNEKMITRKYDVSALIQR